MSGTGAAWRLKGAAPWAAWHSMTFSLCIAQLNFVVGDLGGNVRRIVDAAHEAHAAGARLLLTPELALCGYAAEDLF